MGKILICVSPICKLLDGIKGFHLLSEGCGFLTTEEERQAVSFHLSSTIEAAPSLFQASILAAMSSSESTVALVLYSWSSSHKLSSTTSSSCSARRGTNLCASGAQGLKGLE